MILFTGVHDGVMISNGEYIFTSLRENLFTEDPGVECFLTELNGDGVELVKRFGFDRDVNFIFYQHIYCY